MSQPVSSEIKELLTDATPEQVKWVLARLNSRTDAQAANAVGVHYTTVSRWPNKDRLDRAVHILLSEAANAAKAILIDAAPKAAQVVVDKLSDRRQSLDAAKTLLDRVGVVPSTNVDVTSGGKSLTDIAREMAELERAQRQEEAMLGPGTRTGQALP